MLYIDTIDNAVSMHTVFTNLTSFLNHTRYISYVFLILLVTIVQYQSDFLSLKIKSILKILSNYWSVLHLILFLFLIDFKTYKIRWLCASWKPLLAVLSAFEIRDSLTFAYICYGEELLTGHALVRSVGLTP